MTSDSNLTDDLIKAAQSGNLKLVEELVEHGADVNTKDENGKPVLSLAIHDENFEQFYQRESAGVDNSDDLASWKTIQYLIEHGADGNVKIKDDDTILHYAARYKKWDFVQWLVEHGADVNAKGKWNKTVLHFAAEFGNLEAVQWLVNHGADVNAKNIDGWTVLHYAADEENWEVVQYLVEHGANVNAKNKYGRTALFYGH